MRPIKIRTALAFLALAALASSAPTAGPDVAVDPLPPHVRLRLGTDRFRPGFRVAAVRYAPDGKTIITATDDQTLHWWDADSGKEIRQFKCLTSGVLAPDGRTLASLDVEPRQNIQVIRLWDTVTGKAGPPLGARQANVIYPAVAFSADSRLLAAAERDNNGSTKGSGIVGGLIRLWDAANGKELHRLEGPPPKDGQQGFLPTLLAFSPDGKTLASLGFQQRSGMIHLWDTTTGKLLPALADQPNDPTFAREFRHRGNILARLTLFPPDGGRLTFAPDGKQIVAPVLVSKDDDGGATKLRCWDTATGKRLRDLGEQPNAVSSVLFDAAGQTLAAISQDNQTVHLFDTASGKAYPDAVLDAGVIAVAFAADGKTLALACNSGAAILWDVARGKEVHQLKGFSGQQTISDNGVLSMGQLLAFSRNGRTIAGSGGALVRRWTVADGKEIVLPGAGHEGAVLATVLAPDGKQLFSIGADNTVRFWDLAAGKQTQMFKGPIPEGFNPEDYVNETAALALTADGKTLAIGWGTGAIQLWDAVGGKELKVLKGHDFSITALAFTSNGKALASAGMDGRVFWWDVANGKILRQFAGLPPSFDDPEGMISTGAVHMAPAPDGRTLAIASLDEEQNFKLQLIELATGRQRRSFRIKPEANATPGPPQQLVLRGGIIVSAGLDLTASGLVAFAPDGKTLAWTTGSVVRLWDLTRGRELRRFGVTEGPPIGAVFSPDGKYLAAASREGAVYVWDTANGTVVGQVNAHRGPAQCVAFTTDSATLISGGADTTALFWDVPGVLAAERPRVGELSAAKLKDLWERLAGADGEQADEACRALTAAPKQAVPFLREHVRPVAPADERQIEKLIAQLEDESIAVRQKAEDELEKLGELAEPALELRQTDDPRLTVVCQIHHLLDKLTGVVTHPERMRTLRVIEVLEQIGTPEARAILQTVAEGAPDSCLTQEARASLDRIPPKK